MEKRPGLVNSYPSDGHSSSCYHHRCSVVGAVAAEGSGAGADAAAVVVRGSGTDGHLAWSGYYQDDDGDVHVDADGTAVAADVGRCWRAAEKVGIRHQGSWGCLVAWRSSTSRRS